MPPATISAISSPSPAGRARLDVDDASALTAALHEFLMAGERFRHVAAARLRLGVTDAVALGCLSVRGPMTAGELAEALSLTPGTITALLDRLASAGLARRAADAGDRRRVLVMLTDEGREAAASIEEWMRSAVSGVFERLPSDSTSLLANLAEALRSDIPA